jgi:long-subunit acyl-CoA synthetase (AMP-forming)/heme oxygenase
MTTASLETAALFDGHQAWSAPELAQAVAAMAVQLQAQGTRVLATVLDNGAPFVVLDEAASAAGVVHVPLPPFFTPAQMQHALQAAGVDTLVVTAPHAALWAEATPGLRFTALPPAAAVLPAGSLMQARLPHAAVPLPAGTAKITFTSGTTGTPKGVCLSGAALQAVAGSLVQALAPLQIERHLCALPFGVLLENIAGLMAPRQQGATVIALPLATLGLQGSSSFDAARFDAVVREHQPHSLILLPQMLRAWVGHLMASGQRAPAGLKLVAVGGAAAGAPLVRAAWALGLPVAEGYGLSEGGSVQTLNLPTLSADGRLSNPSDASAGSVGRALPHARLRMAEDGEILVAGALFSGYLGDPTPVPAWWPSGDLGRVDEAGRVFIHGRKKHVLITAYGRNLSPEWVETALRSHPAVLQAVVFGDGEPALSAVLWPTQAGLPDAVLQQAVEAANATLPDYARVQRWVRGRAAFSASTGLATANGRPQRAAIFAAHRDALSSPELPMSFHQRLLQDTAAARQGLLATPIIQGALRGQVSLPSYIAFLTEAYHHVRHTVPLLQALRAALPAHHAWLAPAVDEYIEEEAGHDEWILDDIAACGADAEAVRHGRPAHATEVMVAYAYDTIARGNPLGFFGMVHVLEGTSVSLALMAADAIQKPLQLPDSAFSYLRSHGTLDVEHTAHFATLMDAIEAPLDQAAIVHAARAFFRLYGDVFRGLPLPQPAAAPAAPAQPAEALA